MRKRYVFIVGALIVAGVTTEALANFPLLNSAEGNIGTAISQLRAAPSFYGGHKAAAIRLLYRAENQLQAAKAYRR